MSTWLRVFVVLLVGVSLAPGAWAQGGAFSGFISPGPLSSVHAELDVFPTGCARCHGIGRGVDPNLCMDCHKEIRAQVNGRNGFHGRSNRGRECKSCHADHRGEGASLITIDDNTFDHRKETGFPLQAEHAKLTCRQCHQTPGTYTTEDEACASCHAINDPHGLEATTRSLLEDCGACHEPVADWDALPLPAGVFNHNSSRQSDYPLEGAHSNVDCVECHVDMQFVPVSYGLCTDCHINPHRANFRSRPCEDCHATTETFFVDDFNHALTRYPIEGQHVGVECSECHTQGAKTDPISTRCEGCHADPHRGQFRPSDCGDCHSVAVADFAMREYDHSRTSFPLLGQHATVECEECHGDGNLAVYRGIAYGDCDDCHEDVHDGRHEPTACSVCHIADGFEVQFFDHDNTSFPHTGSHVGLDCEKCHRAGQWNGIPHASCNDCHYPKNPHQEGIRDDTCEDCHNTVEFVDISFDHAANTEFDLAPAHSNQECTSCHEFVTHFDGLEQSCVSCHGDDKPSGHYEGECGDCHQSEHWIPADLGGRDHGITGFALSGAHTLLPCESCHPEGRARGQASPSCISCHASDDPHGNLLGMACADCHGEMSWLRTTFRHHQTGWPLRGAHRLATCYDCHALGYIGTSTDCVQCHQEDATPGIAAHQGPDRYNCDRCHRVYQWSPATFPH